MLAIRTLILCTLVFVSFDQILVAEKLETLKIETAYGPCDIHEPVLIELLESKGVQRLKQIHQYGSIRYVVPVENYSRYDHSLGVFMLLRMQNCSLQEQVAGLLHDASHTAFSHVAEFVFDHHSLKNSYQDDIHDWFLQKSGLSLILAKHGMTSEAINPKQKAFVALDQDLPNLCADRIDYNLQGGRRHGLLKDSDVEEILKDLRFENGIWFFDNAATAKKLAMIPLHFTEYFWGSAWKLLIDYWTSEALKRAIKIDLINLDDVHFSTDDVIWEKLIASQDSEVIVIIDKIRNYEEHFSMVPKSESQLILKDKFRGVNPWIRTEKGLQRLTDIDPEFAAEFKRVKAVMEGGWPIKFVTIPTRCQPVDHYVGY